MFFAHETVKTRINKILSGIEKIKREKYNDFIQRKKALDTVKYNLFALVKAEEEIAAGFQAVLTRMDEKWGRP